LNVERNLRLMKINQCAVHALKEIEERMPEVKLTQEESHKLKSFGAFLLLAAITVFFNRLGK